MRASASSTSTGDGRMDLWLIQGGPLTERDTHSLPGDRLYRNAGTGRELRFEDVTEFAGVHANRLRHGHRPPGTSTTTGDTDVFLANFGANQLLLNTGDGRFRDITAAAGIAGNDWSIAATFADIDADGLLDLYVANYLVFDIQDHEPCRLYSSAAQLLHAEQLPPGHRQALPEPRRRQVRRRKPKLRRGVPARRGDGASSPATSTPTAGSTSYVANDADENFLWLNRGNGRFEDDAPMAGAAVNGNGVAEASMGIAVADFERRRRRGSVHDPRRQGVQHPVS